MRHGISEDGKTLRYEELKGKTTGFVRMEKGSAWKIDPGSFRRGCVRRRSKPFGGMVAVTNAAIATGEAKLVATPATGALTSKGVRCCYRQQPQRDAAVSSLFVPCG